jgi:hypothetical protein
MTISFQENINNSKNLNKLYVSRLICSISSKRSAWGDTEYTFITDVSVFDDAFSGSGEPLSMLRKFCCSHGLPCYISVYGHLYFRMPISIGIEDKGFHTGEWYIEYHK